MTRALPCCKPHPLPVHRMLQNSKILTALSVLLGVDLQAASAGGTHWKGVGWPRNPLWGWGWGGLTDHVCEVAVNSCVCGDPGPGEAGSALEYCGPSLRRTDDPLVQKQPQDAEAEAKEVPKSNPEPASQPAEDPMSSEPSEKAKKKEVSLVSGGVW